MSWLNIKKIVLKCHLLLLYTKTTNHFSIRLWHAMKSGFYMTTSDEQLSSWTEKKLQITSQSQACTKKRSWSLFGGLLWSGPLQLSESQENHYTWEVRSANRWDALPTAARAAGTGQQKGPDSPRQCPTSHCTTHTSKVERIELQSSASSTIFPWPLANRLPLLQASRQLFAGKTL